MILGSSGTDVSVTKRDFSSSIMYYMSGLFANTSLTVNMVLSYKIVPFLIFITF